MSLQKPFTCTKLDQDIAVAVVWTPDGVQIRFRTLPSFILLYSVSVFFFFFLFFICCSRLKSQPRQQTRSFSAHFGPPPPPPPPPSAATPHPHPRLSRADDRLLPLCLCAGKLLCFVNSLPPSGARQQRYCASFSPLICPNVFKTTSQ